LIFEFEIPFRIVQFDRIVLLKLLSLTSHAYAKYNPLNSDLSILRLCFLWTLSDYYLVMLITFTWLDYSYF